MDKNIKWWQNALVYQIYPLSFKDSNHDGIGDIQGIISKLDYLKELGVDVIWLCPIYQSPMDDNGYDISDYDEINPIFGTKKDVNDLIDAVHQRGMKIIMDLVVNHTSDEHIWFKEAKKSKTNPYRDYYIWRDEPSDITSVFSGSAWEYDANSKQYYFHLFSKKQPDLNWDNEALREEIYAMVNRYLDLGIDGFRLDVIDLIGKDVDHKQLSDGPYLEERLKEMYDTCFKGRDIMTVGETPGISIERAHELSEKGYLNMVFQFAHVSLDEVPGKGKWALKPLDLLELKQVFGKSQKIFSQSGWNSLFWSNHDQVRAVTRYGSIEPKFREASAKALFTLLYGLKGTPYLYQGEEIGMTGVDWHDLNRYRDIETLNMYQEAIRLGIPHSEIMKSIHKKGRDNSRTPIQWDDTSFAGFSDTTPWIDVNDNYKTINVASSLNSPNSVLHYVKQLIGLRKNMSIFTTGNYLLLLDNNPNVYAYLRMDLKEQLLVLVNLSKEMVKVNLEAYPSFQVVISNMKPIKLGNAMSLPPYYSAIYHKEATYGNH